MQLRPDQETFIAQLDAQWATGHKNVLGVAPCGYGKTVCFSYVLAREQGATVAIAHRQELVSQMSLTLARNGVRHRVIAPDSVARNCVTLHMAELGRGFYDPSARCAVAGVDTLVRRDPKSDPWFSQVKFVVCDEGHHLLRENKWGRAAAMFPAARVLTVTATAERADGKGLGIHADGIMQAMVVGPSLRDAIDAGWLTEYRVFAPRTSDLDLSSVPISAGGDYSPPKLRAAVHGSHITGDVVSHYLKIAPGKLGLTFAVDVDAAGELAQAYRAAGVTAEVVTAETPDLLRASILRKFRNREILQLCSVDIFGEGFDLPALEVVTFARPTESYPLFVQMFCRVLRRLEGKTHGIVIDHVGNVQRHGLPDKYREWSLDRREKRSSGPNDTIPIRICLKCTSAYEAYRRVCPYCGEAHVPSNRGAPEYVDGVLEEIDPMVLAHLRGQVAVLDRTPDAAPFGMPLIGARRFFNLHQERMNAQALLRTVMRMWGGWQDRQGFTLAEGQARFYHRYGVDVLNAWMLGTNEAHKLREYIEADLTKHGVFDAT